MRLLMYSIVIMVKDIVLYTGKVKRVSIFLPQKETIIM